MLIHLGVDTAASLAPRPCWATQVIWGPVFHFRRALALSQSWPPCSGGRGEPVISKRRPTTVWSNRGFPAFPRTRHGRPRYPRGLMAATFFANRVSTQTNAVTSAWSQVTSRPPRDISRFACPRLLGRGGLSRHASQLLPWYARFRRRVRPIRPVPDGRGHAAWLGWSTERGEGG